MMLQLLHSSDTVLINAVAYSLLTQADSRVLLQYIIVETSGSQEQLTVTLIYEADEFLWLVAGRGGIKIPFTDAPGFISSFQENGSLDKAYISFQREMMRRTLEGAKLLLGAE